MPVSMFFFGLNTLLSCSEEKPQNDDGQSIPDTDDSINIEDSGVLSDYTDPWPEDEVTVTPSFSVLYNGALLSHESNISIDSAPAGFDHESLLQFTITNLSSDDIEFDSLLSSWVDTEGFSWIEPPSTPLIPNESQSFVLAFNPYHLIGATTIETSIDFPLTDIDFSIDLHIDVPPPLRTVFVGHDGYTLVSDDYGMNIHQEIIPSDQESISTQDIEWGNNIFLRACSSNGVYSGTGSIFQYSTNGIDWTNSTVSDTAGSTDCAFGLSNFVCLRGNGAALSTTFDGRTITNHQPLYAAQFLNNIVFTGTHFATAGRFGEKVLATSVEMLDVQTNVADETLGFYEDLAYGGGTLVAVGGSYADRFTLSVSQDEGYSWTEIELPEAETTPNSRLDSVAFNDGLWMVTSNRSKMYQSTNGIDWNVVTTEDAPFALELLGAHHGHFFGLYNNDLIRSENGIDWTVLHPIPEGYTVTAMTSERWEVE